MDHLHVIADNHLVSDNFQKRVTGRYYTHEKIADHMISKLTAIISDGFDGKIIKVTDPFAGDGRLVIWLIENSLKRGIKNIMWDVILFDISKQGLDIARSNLKTLQANGADLKFRIVHGDSFKLCQTHFNSFDIVITNPPWEMIKPDRRELKELSHDIRDKYISSLKSYDNFLSINYPQSQPLRKFAGWGTNLSRVGSELSFNLCKTGGCIALVIPASFFADEQSMNLRKKILSNSELFEISYFPADAKLFGKADIDSSTMVLKKTKTTSRKPLLTVFDKKLSIKSSDLIEILVKSEDNEAYMIPITLGASTIKILNKIKGTYPTWKQLESEDNGLWAGREVDETRSREWLCNDGSGPKFIKGKMINRFYISENPSQYINKKNWKKPVSCKFNRIAWRDVSRASQKRRLIATIIPKNTAAGNSLGVAYFKNGDEKALYALLGIMNSLCFEFQLRCYLATGHISLSAIRKVRLPPYQILKNLKDCVKEVKRVMARKGESTARLEALIAKKVYSLTRDELVLLMDTFDKLTGSEKEEILLEFNKIKNGTVTDLSAICIPNHLSSKLSEMDMAIVRSVPPGGNWKNIPVNIPSKRVATIRESYARGEGSRSTYYGRLQPTDPSYTINTYFNRPGNGCHIHYSQDRVLSQREAARLQSFPDDFTFYGPQTYINKQIGNAVPPLLAYQIALKINRAIGTPGVFIDLFAGAGGLGLGFKWAGWQPLLANDIESRFLETYSKNVHPKILVGSITDETIFNELVENCKKFKSEYSDKPFWILGGPPCQGFSTAGKKRTMNDKRNTLFMNYKELVGQVLPDGFVFENVAGLLNMEKGRVFELVKSEFKSVMANLYGWVLSSENFAIPQRRKRVFLIGTRENYDISPPHPITGKPSQQELFFKQNDWISVREAISDLPEISQGEDGSHLNYISAPVSLYQKFMRGNISHDEYLSELISH